MKKLYNVRNSEYYEIRSLDDLRGLPGEFKSEEDALDKINSSYCDALVRGYDNRDNVWAIVLVRNSKSFKNNGEFIGETIERHLVNRAEFSGYEVEYVLVF